MDIALRVAGAVFLLLLLIGGLAAILVAVIGLGIWLGLLIAMLLAAGLVGWVIWAGATRFVGSSRTHRRDRP